MACTPSLNPHHVRLRLQTDRWLSSISIACLIKKTAFKTWWECTDNISRFACSGRVSPVLSQIFSWDFFKDKTCAQVNK
jgi:hypothetical protein